MSPSAPFIDYLGFLSEQIEGHAFSIRVSARELGELFDPYTTHYRLTREVVVSIYTAHRLQNIRQGVEPYLILDTLGAMRGRFIDRGGDVNQINLIDRIGELTVEYFRLETRPSTPLPAPQASVITGKNFSSIS